MFPVSLDKVEFAIAIDLSGNGKRNATIRVADNGWTRRDSRSKDDERHKKTDQKHDRRLKGKVDPVARNWVMANIALIKVEQWTENSCELNLLGGAGQYIIPPRR